MIPIYIIDDEDWSEADENDWSSIRFFIPTNFSTKEIKQYYIFTFDDGTFELQDIDQIGFTVPSPYRKELPIEFWREFLKNIITDIDITRRAKI